MSKQKASYWMYSNTENCGLLGYYTVSSGNSLPTVAYWGGGGEEFGVLKPPRNSEGPPKSCQTQPDCENC